MRGALAFFMICFLAIGVAGAESVDSPARACALLKTDELAPLLGEPVTVSKDDRLGVVSVCEWQGSADTERVALNYLPIADERATAALELARFEFERDSLSLGTTGEALHVVDGLGRSAYVIDHFDLRGFLREASAGNLSLRM